MHIAILIEDVSVLRFLVSVLFISQKNLVDNYTPTRSTKENLYAVFTRVWMPM